MTLKKLHYLSGILISVFVGLHLFNHLYSLWGAEAHIELMNDLRVVYRNVVAETILLAAVALQIVSGVKLYRSKRKATVSFFGKVQRWTGLYLAVFFLIHVSAVLFGRFVLELDTNFYFGVAGLNTFPFNLFFLPYYTLAIVAFFGHLAALHAQRMKVSLLGATPVQQVYVLWLVGVILTVIILFGLTNGFSGVEIPEAYKVMIGQ